MRFGILLLAFLGSSAFADQFVRGYVKRDGTYVQPYVRSTPDRTPYNNYSTQGNINPYNGNRGYVPPAPAYQYQVPQYPGYQPRQRGLQNDK